MAKAGAPLTKGDIERVARLDVPPISAAEVEATRTFAEKHLTVRRHAIDTAAALADRLPEMTPRPWWPRLHGPASDRHPFAQRPSVFGFSLGEPFFTRQLAAFMQPNSVVPEALAHRRAVLFLRALSASLGGAVMAPPDGVAVVVETERRGKDKKERLDLLFTWSDGGKPHALGIEAKIRGGTLQGNQPACYDSLFEGVVCAGRVVLATELVDLSACPCWQPLRWQTLLPHWETLLEEDASASTGADAEDILSFARFRSALWSATLSLGRHHDLYRGPRAAAVLRHE